MEVNATPANVEIVIDYKEGEYTCIDNEGFYLVISPKLAEALANQILSVCQDIREKEEK